MPQPPRDEPSDAENTALARTATAPGSDSAPAAEAPALNKGDGIGRYTVLEILGSGGMGVVYGAYDPDLDRKVALKLLRASAPTGSGSEADRARLLREARAMAKLSCPNVITVYEVGTVAERDFVAMEFIDGITFADWMKQRHDWREVVDKFRLAGEGLASAHDAGLIHRDFKPANVLIRNDGRVVVTDFGLARMSDETVGAGMTTAVPGSGDSGEQLTRTGAILGTPAYMAPEQYQGKAADERSDQFAFSVALYEALYGDRPFKGDSFDELRAATLAGDIPPEPKGAAVPPWLRAVVLRGLSAAPADRFDSMRDMLRALAERTSTARRWLYAAGGAAVAGAVVIALMTSRGGGDAFERGKRAAQAQQCADVDRSFDGIWDQDKKHAVRAAFDKAAGDNASVTYAGFVRVLDQYKQRWSGIYKRTCQAARVERTLSEEDYYLHLGCLLRRRDQLKSLVEVFSRGDARVVGRAVQAAQELPRIDDCADLKLLRSGLTPPKNPKTRQAIEQVRALLAEARALQQALRIKEGLAMAGKAVELAKKSGYAPVEAEAYYRQARLYSLAEETRQARKAFEQAAFSARLSSYKDYEARTAVARVQFEAKYSSKNATTRKRARLAALMVERYGGDETQHARLDVALGRLALDDGDYAQAEKLLRRAHERLRRALGPEHLRTVAVVQRLAGVEQKRGNYEQALALHQNALASLEKQLGQEHPRVAAAVESVALLLRWTGRYDESRRMFARAKRFWASPAGKRALASFGLPPPAVTKPRDLSGRVVDGQGKPVANADVVVAQKLASDGKYLYAANPRAYEQMVHVYRTRADAAGQFRFTGVSSSSMYIAAEGATGRSWPLRVEQGRAQSNMTLTLRPFGRLEGTVTVIGGRGAAGIDVFAVAAGESTQPRAGVGVVVDRRGHFEIPRLAAGTYLVMLQAGGDSAGRMFSARKVTIAPGKTAKLALKVETGGVNVDMVVADADGKDIGTLQLALFSGHVQAKNLVQVRKAFAGAVKTANTRVGNTKPVAETNSQHFVFHKLSPGKYTVCAVPLGGDIKDPQLVRTLRNIKDELPVRCHPIMVSKKAEQTVHLPFK